MPLLPKIILPELEDQEWCPQAIRVPMVRYLSTIFRIFHPYRAILPELQNALHSTGSERILDLCSGEGGPLFDLFPYLQGAFPELRICRSDLFPVTDDVLALDARSIPRHIRGFRTFFTAFHHFSRADATKILSDAVEAREGIGIFEVTERTWFAFLAVLLTPLLVWILYPLTRPLRLRDLLFVYVFPVVPFCSLWDGIASNLKSHSIPDLEEMVSTFPTYEWRVGRKKGWLAVPVTFLVGVPAVRN
jgi:hypothetical protein